MAAYVIVGFTPKNKELMQEYGAKAASTIAKFKGEFLAKGIAKPLNGKTDYDNQVIIAFPTKAFAEDWYNSPQYQALIDLRDQGMEANFQLIG
ncbi:MAG: DUF1330 domain-containing protein [Cellvibrionaceae bacterium]